MGVAALARASARLGFGARALASRTSRCAWHILDPPGALATTEAPRWARRHGGAPKANNATPAPSGLGIAAVMRELAATDPGAVAVVTSSGEEITYRAIFTTAESIAGSLRATVAAANSADASPSAAAPSPRDPARDDVPSHGDVDANVLRGERVAISATPGPEFIAAVHAAWMCGAIAVPIARGHTRDEVEHVLNDSGAVAFAVVPDRPTLADDHAAAADRWATAADRYARIHDDAVESSGVRATVLVPRVPSADEERASPPLWPAASLEPYASPRPDDSAILIYTSGTTGQPKGALHTHVTLEAQCDALRAAWGWRRDDRILHALPLHHIHGLVNAWMCAHAAGAVVEFGPHETGFAPRATWKRLREGTERRPPITVFMGVPTMYVMLLRTLAAARRRKPEKAAAAAAAAASLRLAVCGSAACPEPVAREWEDATGGRRLLERYGMTEIGMALSNPLEGERVVGAVGLPLPGVETKLAPLPRDGDGDGDVDGYGDGDMDARSRERGFDGAMPIPGAVGELLVRGPGVFREYWNRPEATAESFDDEGYFRTGDAVSIDPVTGVFRILGRTSVDIVKTGGHKVSALEVEAKLLEHPRVREAAVVGVPDDAYGEVGAAIVAVTGEGGDERDDDDDDDDAGPPPDGEELRAWARTRMAEYKVPRSFTFVDAIPRNAMGKVNKKCLRAQLLLVGSAGEGARRTT